MAGWLHSESPHQSRQTGARNSRPQFGRNSSKCGASKCTTRRHTTRNPMAWSNASTAGSKRLSLPLAKTRQTTGSGVYPASSWHFEQRSSPTSEHLPLTSYSAKAYPYRANFWGAPSRPQKSKIGYNERRFLTSAWKWHASSPSPRLPIACPESICQRISRQRLMSSSDEVAFSPP